KGFGPNHDIAGFLRIFERTLIDELSSRGLQATAKESATGVWADDRKVASLGIAVRKWVVYHGMAVNCVNDLKPFHLISPCGFAPEVMTRLADLLPGFDRPEWRGQFEGALAKRLDASSARPEIRELSCAQAFAEAMALDPGTLLA